MALRGLRTPEAPGNNGDRAVAPDPVASEASRDEGSQTSEVLDTLVGNGLGYLDPQDIVRAVLAKSKRAAGEKPLVGEEGSMATVVEHASLLAKNFRKSGMAAYEELLIADEVPKYMYLALLAMGAENGMMGLFMGDPGGGKSQLVKNGMYIVTDIKPDQVAKVPHREDLSPAKLTGEITEFTRQLTSGGQTSSETLRNDQKAILHKGVKVVLFDEINRASPWVVNAYAEIGQDGGVTVWDEEGQKERISGFEVAAASQNSYGARWVHKHDPMTLGRTGVGWFMGDRAEGTLDEAGEAIWDDDDSEDFVGIPDVPGVIDLRRLHEVRLGINFVTLDKDQKELGKKLITNMLDAMRENGINSASRRLGHQVKRIAKTISLMNGDTKVTDEALVAAIMFSMTARLGGAGVTPPKSEEKDEHGHLRTPKQYIDTVIGKVVEKSFKEVNRGMNKQPEEIILALAA